MTENDEYYLAAYRTELADLYREPGSNAVDGTDNDWSLTRYHDTGAAAGHPAVNAVVNGSNSVDADSDVAAAVKTDGTAGTAGGMVIASRVADTTAGAASDGTGADPATDANRTTRSHDGQVILAQAAQADKNVNAHITLPAGEGMGPQAETYDWIMDPDTVDVDGTAVAVPVQAGDVGQVQAPRQAISGFMWMDGDNAGNGNDGLYDDGTVSGTAEAPVEGLAVALERYVITAEQQADGSFAVAPDATWERDADWADNWEA